MDSMRDLTRFGLRNKVEVIRAVTTVMVAKKMMMRMSFLAKVAGWVEVRLP